MSPLVLWHIVVSHYSEKVRWALDWKGLEYTRRAPMPGAHMVVALALTGGRHFTFPVLELDGQRIGDSTAIIAALEQRCPEPALYPSDPAQRHRALELEDWFDERLGPYIRRFEFHELYRDRALFRQIARSQAPRPMARFERVNAAYARALTVARFGAGSERAARRARERVLAALDRLELELGGNDYLVGDRFTVADLTAAALFYPLVMPAEGPVKLPIPADLDRFRRSLSHRRAFGWVEEMFRRHRHESRVPHAVEHD